MKLSFKKILPILLSVFLVAGIMASCGNAGEKPETAQNATQAGSSSGNNDAVNAEEPMNMRFVGPGTAPGDMEAVEVAINEKLKTDGLNLNFSTTFIPWDAWDQKINIMLSTGEEFDLFHVFTNISSYVSRGALVKLNDYIDEHGTNMKTLFTEPMWEPLKVKGDIYGIPAYWRDITDYGGQNGIIGARKDQLDKNNLPVPTTLEELESSMEILQKNWGGNEKVYATDHELQRTPVWLHRTYSSWPFYVDFFNGTVFVDQQGNVKSWIETEEFKKDCEVMRRWYKKGLINPDILSLPSDTRSKLADKGEILMGLGTFGYEAIPQLKKIDPGFDMIEFKLAPEKPNLVFDTIWNMNVVPSTTKNPEAAVKFLEWLYSSDENHDLLVYGIKDRDYKAAENGRIERIMDNNKTFMYDFPFWQIAYYTLSNFEVTDSDKYIEKYTKTDETAEYSIVAGFIFNPEPVKTEYANVTAEMTNNIWPIKWGLVDYDEYFPKALEKMKAAGIDKVVAEYDKQLKEWLANKK